MDLVSAERCAQERLPVSGLRHLQPQRRHARRRPGTGTSRPTRTPPSRRPIYSTPRPRPGRRIPLPERESRHVEQLPDDNLSMPHDQRQHARQRPQLPAPARPAAAAGEHADRRQLSRTSAIPSTSRTSARAPSPPARRSWRAASRISIATTSGTCAPSCCGYPDPGRHAAGSGLERPYIQLPRLTAAALWSPQRWPQLVTGFDSELVNFTRSSHRAALRYECRPAVLQPGCPAPSHRRWSTRRPGPASAAGAWTPSRSSGWTLRPRLLLPPECRLGSHPVRAARYASARPDSSPQRSLPILDIDSGLQFERLIGSGDRRSVTLEPRVMYVYIPYRDQNSAAGIRYLDPGPELDRAVSAQPLSSASIASAMQMNSRWA